MQTEIGQAAAILGINNQGAQHGNDEICDGRDIPWLQDIAPENVWALWNVTYRDVIILDADNIPVGVFNLTEHDLGDPADYAELKALLTR